MSLAVSQPTRSAARPRVLASDLDGTLLPSSGVPADRTRRALESLAEAGIAFIMVTARPPCWVDVLADYVGDHGLVLCSNGAFVYDVGVGEVIGERTFQHAHVGELVTDLRREIPGAAFAVEHRQGWFGEPGYHVSDRYPGPEVVCDDILTALEPLPGKLLVRAPGHEGESLHEAAARVVAGRAEVAYSGAGALAEISPLGVTKAAALAEWCEQLGVSAAEVWAFGDMPNDIPMLAWAGRGFAVEDAHPLLVEVASDRCPGPEDDGVAQVIEALLS